jgi:hypothetical protein
MTNVISTLVLKKTGLEYEVLQRNFDWIIQYV